MSTINKVGVTDVENVPYEFQDIPGKGKCLVPTKVGVTDINPGDVYKSKTTGNVWMVTRHSRYSKTPGAWCAVNLNSSNELEGYNIGSGIYEYFATKQQVLNTINEFNPTFIGNIKDLLPKF